MMHPRKSRRCHGQRRAEFLPIVRVIIFRRIWRVSVYRTFGTLFLTSYLSTPIVRPDLMIPAVAQGGHIPDQRSNAQRGVQGDGHSHRYRR